MELKDLKVYGFNIEYKDKLDLLQKALEIYAALINITKDNVYLRPKLVKVLAFYMLFDYSNETKDIIRNSLGKKLHSGEVVPMDEKNLNQINCELTSKGFLIRDRNNMRKKHLSNETKILKEYFLSGDYMKIFMTKFTKI
jgi:hypothetical protein